MKLLWIILFLLQGTDGFLIKNTKVNLCLQASTDKNLLIEDCNSTLKSQHWFWQNNSLVNRGTRKCLSVAEVNRVQTSPCDSRALVNWDCFNFWLQPMGIQKYLAVKKNKAVLTDTQSPNSQWRGRGEQNICDEKPAKTKRSRYTPMALANTGTRSEMEGDTTPAASLSQEQLNDLLWFFRREDSSTWNYSILALSFVVLVLGLLLLGMNVTANRKRKILLYKKAAEGALLAETRVKHVFMPVGEQSNLNPLTQDLLPKEQKAGDVLVQWRDGTVTALYADKFEDA
ncbi:PREDICTED: organic solute transporter subunit beta [Crocodylus porosus]|uniref:organic solute transporter subunit beta n=1 Tax=Crocodylus porosus TaxID=8502 RepID=UPI00093B49B7|nr:PREDICTED: organic solute transporter subunit beta [Crocodylus porosus]XP_019389361.1 PREDICTED: organic solute transporter subunit beta [Crocodylus porosus]XP_019389362.1 PREDICTED: organic solute transporter subunit beta [Crocodylus porosus]